MGWDKGQHKPLGFPSLLQGWLGPPHSPGGTNWAIGTVGKLTIQVQTMTFPGSHGSKARAGATAVKGLWSSVILAYSPVGSHRITIGIIIIPIVVLIMSQTLSSPIQDDSLGCDPQEAFPLSASVPGRVAAILPGSGQRPWASASSPAQGGGGRDCQQLQEEDRRSQPGGGGVAGGAESPGSPGWGGCGRGQACVWGHSLATGRALAPLPPQPQWSGDLPVKRKEHLPGSKFKPC